ncbi:MAG TPA: hypothetical protein DCY48_03535 [Candidatus Magasanikbacteria bacterium]|nr:MAG: hypothetical protein A3I74_04740 [Candidatus Magasanikbacteria bacterium RIFCSPLOWO2_02_FULL_47_16]OGH79513.1 MAG: hypothetical protein A3C10_01710 [Candidatus Magasanikbacteria bacterium RIFCSPHIGHO2_02_FULL_48_18]OGH81953.1 MAG: hypothetical protein A3G08_01975 [Candidatus Magasanikbacteria bacterium RIFCSPLOWO2_12_FULL_47_9b]HAZ28816.1 hypothetical protein [Candidatus Magasanikbacteria bacterium]
MERDIAQPLGDRIADIEARNRRVEADKAWEISFTRRIVIFFLTYSVAALWLWSIHDTYPLLKALVPALGWLFSTMTLPVIRSHWIKKYTQKC